jgi:hypothetical protein
MDSDGFGFANFRMKPKYSNVLKDVLFKIDCGASDTTIRKDSLIDLGWSHRDIALGSSKPKEFLLAANNAVIGRSFKFPLFNFCDTDFVNVDLFYLEGENDFKNLLGMNILMFFLTVIDPDNREIRIERGKKENPSGAGGIGSVTGLRMT